MSILASWLASPPLEAALEISPAAVSVAVLGGRSANPVVQGYAVEPLPPGAVTPSLTSTNIADPDAVARALDSACQSLGLKPKRVAVVIPDVAAKVSLVRFDQIPTRRDDLNQFQWTMPASRTLARTKRAAANSSSSSRAERQSANTRASANESALKPVSWTSPRLR